MNRTRFSVDRENLLIERAKNGCTESYGELVRMYQNRLFNVVLQISRCHADAEDIVQDAFVQAFINLPNFRHGSAFYTWLYRIAVNLTISRGRQRRRRRTLSLDLSQEIDGTEPQDTHEGPETRIEREENTKQFQLALNMLSDEHRTILTLRGIEGFDYQAIGDVLGLNAGTVRSRLHRARANLRANMETTGAYQVLS